MSEAKEGEFTLTYNRKENSNPVALTKEQHRLLQIFLSGIGEISVMSDTRIEYHPNRKTN